MYDTASTFGGTLMTQTTVIFVEQRSSPLTNQKFSQMLHVGLLPFAIVVVFGWLHAKPHDISEYTRHSITRLHSASCGLWIVKRFGKNGLSQ